MHTACVDRTYNPSRHGFSLALNRDYFIILLFFLVLLLARPSTLLLLLRLLLPPLPPSSPPPPLIPAPRHLPLFYPSL